jgi:hypothetical protein
LPDYEFHEPHKPMNTGKLKSFAPDLRQNPPRSPHDKLGGHVIAARSLDKCRAFLLGINGEYNFHPCGLSAFLWEFTGITPDQFKEFVSTGAGDEEVGQWLRERSKVKDPLAIIRWNNELKCKLISELADSYQEYYEEYVPQFCPHPARVRFFFDVYDDEEGRL